MPKTKIRFIIHTLGCKVNQYDSATLTALLSQGDNFILAKSNEKIDLVLINSCSVTKTAITKSRYLIRQEKKRNPQAKVILFGCWPKVYQVSAQELGLDYVFNTTSLEDLASKIKEIFIVKNEEQSSKKNYLSCLSSFSEDRSRYFIKVQDGCQQFCSYCIIPFARGPLRSRPVEEIRLEVREAIKNGFSEIVLSGIHLGLYGHDFKKEKISLSDLLRELLKLKGLGRLRLSSIEINEVTDDLINLIAESDKVCRHLHIPLQAGSDKILKLMNRPYNSDFFIERIKKIRAKITDIALSTDIIVGFPGESELDFMASYKLSQKIAFSKIHVFSFSAHEKAPAYHFPEQIDRTLIKERSKKLRTLSKKLENDYRKLILNKYSELAVLIESFSSKGVRAKTEFYFDLFLSLDDLERQKIIKNKDTSQVKKIIGQIFNYYLR